MNINFLDNNYVSSMFKIWRLKNLSDRTIINYIGHLRRYLAIFPDPTIVSLEQQWDYFLTIQTPTHRNQQIAVIRQLHEFILKKPISFTDLPYANKSHKLPEYFTEEEVSRLLQVITHPKQRCCIALQFLCGLRVNEVINVRLTDINSRAGTLLIHGKGNKQRIVPLPESAINYLKLYWNWVQPKPKTYLFTGQHGGKYSARSIQIAIKNAKNKIGMTNKSCSTHGLRHGAATARINKYGWNLRQVQVFLGHRNSKTTERYTHVSIEHLKELPAPGI